MDWIDIILYLARSNWGKVPVISVATRDKTLIEGLAGQPLRWVSSQTWATIGYTQCHTTYMYTLGHKHTQIASGQNYYNSGHQYPIHLLYMYPLCPSHMYMNTGQWPMWHLSCHTRLLMLLKKHVAVFRIWQSYGSAYIVPRGTSTQQQQFLLLLPARELQFTKQLVK